MEKNIKKKRLVLLDSHAIIHRAYHALPDFANSKGEPTGALYGLSTMLISIIDQFKPDYIVACFDLPKPTHRHIVFKEYKAGRAKTDDELILQINRSKDLLKAFNIPIYEHEGFEADDVLGTIVYELKKDLEKEEIEIIIASGDMDTLQLVSGDKVTVFTLKRGIKDTILYDEDAVIKRYEFGPELMPDYKGLRGDPSDNIPGIKGVGEKTATILIKEFGTIENLYKELKKADYKIDLKGISPRIMELLRTNEEEATFSKMLATIRIDAPINFSLPNKTFKENIDYKAAENIFAELEFRTLGTRLKQTINGTGSTQGKNKSEEKTIIKEGKSLEQNPTLFGNEDVGLVEETALALWLVQSNITNPKAEDIISFTKTEDIKKAREIIFEEIKKRNLTRVFEEIERPLIPVLKEMEKIGIKIDTDYLKKLSSEYHSKLNIAEKEIWKMAGKNFNIASPKQLGEVLFVEMGLKAKRQKKTSTGALSTRESELEKLRDEHPIIEHILNHRELSKLLGTYIDTMPTLVDQNSRLHTHFIQTGASTGRMASENPNLQNIPNKTDLGRAIRKAFVAEKGWKLLAIDYSQMELRIAAFMSKDPALIEIFHDGQDVHSAVASKVFGVPVEEITKEMRNRAKVINFGMLYGMGVSALQKNLGTTREEAQKFYNDYFKTFSTLATYLDKIKAEAERKGYVETVFGRKRYFEGIKSRLPHIKAAAERMAINAPIQGTEADIVKRAMIDIYNYINEKSEQKSARILLQVHDELVFEVLEGHEKEFADNFKDIMESVMRDKDTEGITLVAEAHVGDNWGEMKSI